MSRRTFLKQAVAGSTGIALLGCKSDGVPPTPASGGAFPRIISTWQHGLAANDAAWKTLQSGGSGLDAVEAGVRIPEADPEVRSVGYGGYPDREGIVTLDACIMDAQSRCGSVAFLRDIKHPISVARLVMEKTPHIMLCGDGALEFALEQGFERENLLTEASRLDWEKWKETSQYRPVINIENHDTISMLLIDGQQNLYAACTTSGAAWKMHGRIGDSPIIGAGLFLDNEVGAAAATGLGEAVIRTAGSAMIVEAMRHGMSPDEACRMVVERISNLHKNDPDWENLQVGFIALNKRGVYGSYSLRPGFDFAVTDQHENSHMVQATYAIGQQV
mgnify:CR=1 FL=1|jgi:N4-(beta-N-acetylglucosaminyl)-L-asparaginase